MCRRISGERAFVSDMFALCIVAAKGLENGSVEPELMDDVLEFVARHKDNRSYKGKNRQGCTGFQASC